MSTARTWDPEKPRSPLFCGNDVEDDSTKDNIDGTSHEDGREYDDTKLYCVKVQVLRVRDRHNSNGVS